MNLSLIANILSGLSKSIYFINEIKPIYTDLVPLFKNGSKIINKFKSNLMVSQYSFNNYSQNEDSNSYTNLPKFFI